MKKILLPIALLVFIFGNAQFNQDAPWMKNLDPNKSSKVNFQEVVDAFNAYWETRDPDVKGSGYKPFKRWEAYWQNFVGEDGYLPTSAELFNTAMQIQQNRNEQDDESNWISLGPTDFLNRPTSTANIGRVNVIIQDPTAGNGNIYYAGAPAGGIWKSTDSGSNWTPLIDNLPQIGVSGIAVDYNDNQTIYIATGDDDAGDAAGVGVWKSTDGGATWAATGLNPGNSPSRMNDIYIDPTNSNRLWVATTSGVFRTTDGGTNWTNTQTGNIRDLKIKPGDPNTVYAVSSSTFYRSTNGGASFTPSTTGLPTSSNRLVIDVTPANANAVFVVSANTGNNFQGVYKSTNSGASFTQTAETNDIFNSSQSWYDLAFAVSDTDEDEMYVGVLDIWKSTNGGDSFTQINQWFSHTPSYTHADIHFLRFYGGELYCGSDGGFFKSDNGGQTFTDFTEGMEISQFYRISVSQQTSTKIAGGTQDNGGFGYSNQWNNYHGGDGMEGVIDPNNDNLYYGFMQFGQNLFRSNDSGQSGSNAVGGPENGNWITPLAVNDDGEVYGAYSSLYRLDGNAWTQLAGFGVDADALEIDPMEPDNMYVAINNSLRKSTDRGDTFSAVESFSSFITSIEVNNNDSNIIYVTTSGTTGSIFRSTDGGNTFTNIGGTIPNVSKNIVKHQKDATGNPLYVGTSVGVYRYDDNTADWEIFANNLPNTAVRDLAINLPDNKIVAGTYGRGIWISDLATTALADNDLRLVQIEGLSGSSIECGDIMTQIEVENNGQNTITSIDVSYSIDAGANNDFTWTGTLESTNSTLIDLPLISLPRGEHTLAITTSISNDAFPNNNNSDTTFFVNDSGVAQLVNTFEAVTDELITFNDDTSVLWERGVPAGALLNAAASGTNVYGTNLDGNHPDLTKAYLVSQCYDLSAITQPVLKFNMAFDLEFDWDIVFVEYTTDEGATWSHLGNGDAEDNWYNSTRLANDGLGNDCFNCLGGQWTGTEADIMNQYTRKLEELTTEPSVIFRVVLHSDQSVNEEGAIIDDFYVDGTLSTEDFTAQNIAIFPNPSKDVFNVKTTNIFDFEYNVVDITGKVVTQQSVRNENGFTLDMSGYASGMYFLNISDKSGKQLTKKLILQ